VWAGSGALAAQARRAAWPVRPQAANLRKSVEKALVRNNAQTRSACVAFVEYFRADYVDE
jgi:hypothetical protein